MLPGVGVFGTGSLARRITESLKSLDFNVVAVWGKTVASAKEFAEDLGIPFYTVKVDEVLLHKDVGLLAIACPPHLQSPISVKALGIGKHVIASPPTGPSQFEVLKMVHASRYYPTLLAVVCHGFRYFGAYVKARQLLTDGYIGEPYVYEARVRSDAGHRAYDWECDEAMGGGTLSTQGCHVIDILAYLSGRRARKVLGYARTYVKRTESIGGIREITSDDFCAFQMELEGGATASCTLNGLCQGEPPLHELVVCGSRGKLTVRDSDLFGKTADTSEEVVLHHEPPPRGGWRGVSGGGSLTQERLSSGAYVQGLHVGLQAIADAFGAVEEQHGLASELLRSPSTFEDALYVQTVIDAVRKSSKTQQWQKVDVLSEEPDPNPHLSSIAPRRSMLGIY